MLLHCKGITTADFAAAAVAAAAVEATTLLPLLLPYNNWCYYTAVAGTGVTPIDVAACAARVASAAATATVATSTRISTRTAATATTTTTTANHYRQQHGLNAIELPPSFLRWQRGLSAPRASNVPPLPSGSGEIPIGKAKNVRSNSNMPNHLLKTPATCLSQPGFCRHPSAPPAPPRCSLF